MIIKGYDIFLTWNQYNELVTPDVRKKLRKLPHIDSSNLNKVLKEKNRILFEELVKKFDYKEKALEFINEWMKFDINGNEAKENTWNLLNDYCNKNSFAFLRDNRSFENRLKSDYLDKSYSYYPLGKDYSLIYIIPERKNWLGKIKNSTEIEILIETEKVKRIKGEFKSLFTIYTNEYKYIFGSGLSIIPIEK